MDGMFVVADEGADATIIGGLIGGDAVGFAKIGNAVALDVGAVLIGAAGIVVAIVSVDGTDLLGLADGVGDIGRVVLMVGVAEATCGRGGGSLTANGREKRVPGSDGASGPRRSTSRRAPRMGPSGPSASPVNSRRSTLPDVPK